MLTPEQQDAIIRTVAGEARGEPPEGQQAVAHVILNRAAQSGEDPTEVVSDKNQFESYMTPSVQQLDPNSKTYQKIKANLQPVFDGTAPDPTNGADHFLNPTLQAEDGRKQPNWAQGQGVSIGQHVFHRVGYTAPSAKLSDSQIKTLLGTQGNSGNAEIEGGQAPLPETNAPQLSDDQVRQLAHDAVGPPQAAPGQPAPTASQEKAQAMAGRETALEGQGGNGFVNEAASGAMFGLRPALGAAVDAGANAVQNGLASLGVGSNTGMSSGDVFEAKMKAEQAAQDAYAKAHPVAATVGGALGALGSGVVGGAEKLAAGGVNAGLRALAPGVDAASAPIANAAINVGSRLAGAGAVGAGFGATHALQNEESPADVAKEAGAGGLLGAALGGIGEGVLGGASALGRRLGILKNPEGAEASALDLIDRQGTEPVDDALSQASPLQTAAEALPQGSALAQKVADVSPEGMNPIRSAVLDRSMGAQSRLADETEDALGINPANAQSDAETDIQEAAESALGTQAQQAAIEELQQPANVQARTVDAVRAATGENPASAGSSVSDQVDAIRSGPARDLYDAALQGNGVWSPTLQKLADEPAVRQALNGARKIMDGDEALTPNPDKAQPVKTIPDRMTAEELNQRLLAAGKKTAPGQEITGDDLIKFLQESDKDPTRWQMEAPKEPDLIPTDKMWDVARKLYSKRIMTMDPAEKVVARNLFDKLSTELDAKIPGYKAARDTAGDYLSRQEAADNAPRLGEPSGESAEAFSKRYAAMKPGEQDATRKTILAKLYEDLDRGKVRFDRLSGNPREQKILETAFGTNAARAFKEHFAKEATFAKAKPGKGLEQTLRERYKQGLALASTTAKSPQAKAVAAELETMTPQERRMVQLGHAAALNAQMGTAKGIDPEKILSTPHAQDMIRLIHGEERGGKFLDLLTRERDLAKQGAAIADTKGKGGKGNGLPIEALAAAGLGGGPHALGAVLAEHVLHKAAAPILDRLTGKIPPDEADALGQLLALKPEILQGKLNARRAQRKETPLSRSALSSVAGAAGGSLENALSAYIK